MQKDSEQDSQIETKLESLPAACRIKSLANKHNRTVFIC